MKAKCPFRSLGARSKNCPYMFGGDCKSIEVGPENGDSWCRAKIEHRVSNSASVVCYGAKPLPVIGGMAIILNQRRDECKECKWHPDVCEYCEINKLENERIEKEMAS